MLFVQLRAQQAVKKVSGVWGQRKQKTDLGSIEIHTPKKEGERSNAEDPAVTLK